MAYMTDIIVDQDNNCILFKNNIKYVWEKFIQASKISKRSLNIFLNTYNLTLM